MIFRKLQDEEEADIEFKCKVPSWFNARNDSLGDDLNTLVVTYTTDLATNTDIWPTAAAVLQVQEAYHTHA